MIFKYKLHVLSFIFFIGIIGVANALRFNWYSDDKCTKPAKTKIEKEGLVNEHHFVEVTLSTGKNAWVSLGRDIEPGILEKKKEWCNPDENLPGQGEAHCHGDCLDVQTYHLDSFSMNDGSIADMLSYKISDDKCTNGAIDITVYKHLQSLIFFLLILLSFCI